MTPNDSLNCDKPCFDRLAAEHRLLREVQLRRQVQDRDQQDPLARLHHQYRQVLEELEKKLLVADQWLTQLHHNQEVEGSNLACGLSQKVNLLFVIETGALARGAA